MSIDGPEQQRDTPTLSRREACGILAAGVLAAISLDMRNKAQSLERGTENKTSDQDLYDEDEESSGISPNAVVSILDNPNPTPFKKCTALARLMYRDTYFKQNEQTYDIPLEDQITDILMYVHHDTVEQLWNEYVAMVEEHRKKTFVFGNDGGVKRYSFKQVGSFMKFKAIKALIEKYELVQKVEKKLQFVNAPIGMQLP